MERTIELPCAGAKAGCPRGAGRGVLHYSAAMRTALGLALSALPLAACAKDPKPSGTTTSGAAPAPVLGAQARAEQAPVLPAPGTAPPAVAAADTLAKVWDVPLTTLRGEPTTLAAHRGKAVLIVNVASKCGLTPQYTGLEALQKKYAGRGFTVLGFPSNQFGGQEPGSAEEIETFCSTTYGVTFPMMSKVEVNGAGRNPVYAALTTIADAGGYTGDIRWNFEKFLIAADGTHVTRLDPKTKPDDPTTVAAVEAALPR